MVQEALILYLFQEDFILELAQIDLTTQQIMVRFRLRDYWNLDKIQPWLLSRKSIFLNSDRFHHYCPPFPPFPPIPPFPPFFLFGCFLKICIRKMTFYSLGFHSCHYNSYVHSYHLDRLNVQ